MGSHHRRHASQPREWRTAAQQQRAVEEEWLDAYDDEQAGDHAKLEGEPPPSNAIRLADERLWAAEDRAKRAEEELRELKAKSQHAVFWHTLEREVRGATRRAELAASNDGAASFAFTGRDDDVATRRVGGSRAAAITRPRKLVRAQLDELERRRATARWPAKVMPPPPSNESQQLLADHLVDFRVGTALRACAPLNAEPSWRIASSYRLQRTEIASPSESTDVASQRAGFSRSTHSARSTPCSLAESTSYETRYTYSARSHPWLRKDRTHASVKAAPAVQRLPFSARQVEEGSQQAGSSAQSTRPSITRPASARPDWRPAPKRSIPAQPASAQPASAQPIASIRPTSARPATARPNAAKSAPAAARPVVSSPRPDRRPDWQPPDSPRETREASLRGAMYERYFRTQRQSQRASLVEVNATK